MTRQDKMNLALRAGYRVVSESDGKWLVYLGPNSDGWERADGLGRRFHTKKGAILHMMLLWATNDDQDKFTLGERRRLR